MADFYGCREATAFRVKNRDAWLADQDVQQLTKYAQSEGFIEENDGYWSFGWYDQYPSSILTTYDGDDELETDIAEAVRRHILPGDACQIGVSGNEKLRYIGGALQFVTAQGVTYLDGQTSWEDRLTYDSLRTRITQLSSDIAAITKEGA